MLTAVSALIGLSYSLYLVAKADYWFCKARAIKQKSKESNSED